MILTNKAFIFAQCIYILVALMSLLLMPGASVMPTLLAMLGVWIVVSIVYNSTQWKNNAGWWTLLIVSMVLSIGVVANVHYFTIYSGGTTQLPILHNPDAFRYYYDALYTVGHSAGVAVDVKNHGYGMLISWIWSITGETIVAPMVLNMLFVLIGIILSGGITYRILQGQTPRSDSWIATCAMIMTSSVCYFLNSGTLLLKEAGLIFSFSLIAYVIVSISQSDISKTRLIKLFALFFVGGILLTILRFNYLIMVVVGIVMMTKWQKRNMVLSGVLLLICVCCWFGESTFLYSDYSQMPQVATKIIGGKGLNGYFFIGNEDHQMYNMMVDGYLGYPWWKKVALLPMTATVQYLIPLPWGFCDDIQFGYTLAYAHISYPWYLIGGLILYFIVFEMRRASIRLQRIIIWGMLMWLVPAFLFAGTVSRYALPLLSLIIPAAVFVVAKWQELNKLRLKVWCWSYGMLLVIGLALGYIVQKGVLL